jgi:hypothetical protein
VFAFTDKSFGFDPTIDLCSIRRDDTVHKIICVVSWQYMYSSDARTQILNNNDTVEGSWTA